MVKNTQEISGLPPPHWVSTVDLPLRIRIRIRLIIICILVILIIIVSPPQVSKLLNIPLARVEAMDHRIAARTSAQFKHGVHSMMLAANITSMSSCNHKHEKCEPLAKNLLAVAAEIETTCASKFFNDRAFKVPPTHARQIPLLASAPHSIINVYKHS